MQVSDRSGASPREEFRQRQRTALDAFFSLTTGEEAARSCFEAMALETYDQLADADMSPYCFSLDAESAFNFANEHEDMQKLISPDLRRRWQSWKGVHRELLERNPRLALHDLLHWIGETNDFSSWPTGLEPAISDWIDSGRREPMPFDDRRDIVTPEFYENLRRARREANGFIVYRSGEGTVFLPEADWRREKAGQEERRAEQSRRQNEEIRHADRLRLRTARTLVQAQGDPDFWEALRSREIAREKLRPVDGGREHGAGLVGPIGIQIRARGAPASQTEFDDIPLDKLLADFVRRVQEPEDGKTGLTATLIVVLLRGTMRDELGLDGMLVWPGGPSLGEGKP